MLGWALTFLIVALIAAVLGFGDHDPGIAGRRAPAAGTAPNASPSASAPAAAFIAA